MRGPLSFNHETMIEREQSGETGKNVSDACLLSAEEFVPSNADGQKRKRSALLLLVAAAQLGVDGIGFRAANRKRASLFSFVSGRGRGISRVSKKNFVFDCMTMIREKARFVNCNIESNPIVAVARLCLACT